MVQTQNKKPNLNIEYKKNLKIPYQSLDELIDAAGWGKRGKDNWEKVLSKSSPTISAWDGEKLVGFGRLLEDGVMCMVCDVVVYPDYQGCKIGSTIMKYIVSAIKKEDYQSVGLFAWNKNIMNIPFYEKFGFKKVDFGMKLKNK